MKIAYVYFSSGRILTGPKNKISGQARAAQEAGLAMDFLVLHDGKDHTEGNVRYTGIPYSFKEGVVRKIQQTFFKFRYIKKLLDFNNYDGVILRYPLVDDLTPAHFFHAFGNKVITEHNTNELAELKLAWNRDISLPLRFLLEKFNEGPALSKVAGIIGVTEEIRKIELKKAGPKQSVVVANGIDTEAVTQTGFIPFDGETLTIVFLVSESAAWQGIDRLIRGLRQYRGNTAIHLFLIGNISPKYARRICRVSSPNITVQIPGTLYGTDLDAVFSRATIAVSTLGLYRKKMREACPLKSREYVARGIPFIYAYDDPDIPSPCNFALKYENDDAPVSIDRIIDFAYEVSARESLSHEMRQFARDHLDWRIKLVQMYDFAAQVFKNTGMT